MFDFKIDRATFADTVYEKTPLLIRGAFAPLGAPWSIVDAALDQQDCSEKFLKIVLGRRLDPETYTEQYVDIGLRRQRLRKGAVYDLLHRGATIVMNRIELVSPEVRAICLEIGRFVGAQTSANAYACLGGEPATNVHWDTHDVFIVQASGSKRWEIFEPTHLLPISSQPSNDRKGELSGKPVIDEILSVGDLLYVPRGWWHKVAPVEASDTVHFTVAIHPPLILDYFVWACANVLPGLGEVRHGLIGLDDDPARIAAAIASASGALADPANQAAFLARSRERDRVDSPFNIEGLLRNADAPLPGDTAIFLNSRSRLGPDPSAPAASEDAAIALLELLGRVPMMSWAELREALPDIPADALQAAARGLALHDAIQLRNPDLQ